MPILKRLLGATPIGEDIVVRFLKDNPTVAQRIDGRPENHFITGRVLHLPFASSVDPKPQLEEIDNNYTLV